MFIDRNRSPAGLLAALAVLAAVGWWNTSQPGAADAAAAAPTAPLIDAAPRRTASGPVPGAGGCPIMPG
ncbi:MAG: hypothetical protein U1F11_04235 [Steroidobacteraceae bacterium]